MHRCECVGGPIKLIADGLLPPGEVEALAGHVESGERCIGILDTLKTVLAGMLGVRGRAAHESQSASLKPLHVIVAGVVVAVVLVLTLVAIVRWVVG